jgi:choline-sulfatase
VAEEFLLRDHASPFLLLVNFYEPHSPFRLPVEYRGRFSSASFTVPEVGREDRDQLPRVFAGLTDEEKRGIVAACYTSVEFMDKNVGLVLDALDRFGTRRQRAIAEYAANEEAMIGTDRWRLVYATGRRTKTGTLPSGRARGATFASAI